jgi:hypothetical protein
VMEAAGLALETICEDRSATKTLSTDYAPLPS